MHRLMDQVPAPRLSLLGAPLDPLTMHAALRIASDAVAGGPPVTCGTLNSAVVAMAQRDDDLRDAMWRLDLVTADGQWVVRAARLFGHSVPGRVSGIDLMEALLAAADAHGRRVFVLGARPDVLARAAAVIARRFPGVTIAGMQHGYFAPEEEAGIVRRIAAARADLLFVAMPTPAKERFLARNARSLGVAFAMGVGGSIDVLAGSRRRAPEWMQRAGLEWLIRYLQEPRRLAPVMRANGAFAALVMTEALRRLLALAAAAVGDSAAGARRRAPGRRRGVAPPSGQPRHSPRSSRARRDRDEPGTARE
jgi:N-acetylglucosaminyldiphosphoundecaprenol N-acetyl-beta-D-mannosaminyltransferase